MSKFDPNAPATQGELLAMARLLIEERRTVNTLIGWLESLHKINLKQRIQLCREADRQELEEAQAAWDEHEAACKANGIDPNTGEVL